MAMDVDESSRALQVLPKVAIPEIKVTTEDIVAKGMSSYDHFYRACSHPPKVPLSIEKQTDKVHSVAIAVPSEMEVDQAI
jgi:hypothetical protein